MCRYIITLFCDVLALTGKNRRCRDFDFIRVQKLVVKLTLLIIRKKHILEKSYAEAINGL